MHKISVLKQNCEVHMAKLFPSSLQIYKKTFKYKFCNTKNENLYLL